MVPFLVLLPLVESNELEGQSTMTLVYALGPTALKTLGGLGLLLLGGRFVLRRLFQLVAESRSDETFVALCLLTVTGASLCTQRLGFSDTLGAFVAGVLLAETNYRTQVRRCPSGPSLPATCGTAGLAALPKLQAVCGTETLSSLKPAGLLPSCAWDGAHMQGVALQDQ